MNCPNCGSSNVSFSREKQGEIKGKRGTAVIRSTVGICKDCGYTWENDSGTKKVKKRKTWLWVLGWICIFPIPLTILLLRKKDMKLAIKYGIIAIAWVTYLIIGLSGNSEKTDVSNTGDGNTTSISSTVITESAKESHIYDNAKVKDVHNGVRTEKIGEYSVIHVASSECTEEALADWYYNYVKVNSFNYNIILFTDKNDNTGCYAANGIIEVGTVFIEDKYGDYSVGNTQNSVIYAPADDGETLTKMAD